MKRLKIREKIMEKALREGVALTSTDVARAINVSHNTILAYVRGERTDYSLVVVRKLAAYFGCSIEDLIEDEERMAAAVPA